MANYIGAIDQGTTSTRFIVFDRSGRIVSVAQKEHEQIFPHPGWVEHDANEIWRRTREVIAGALEQRGLVTSDLAAIGITNQRETTVVWDRHSGAPVYNALVWQDTRTAGAVAELARNGGGDRFRTKTGLPLATYFSALKIRWILDNVSGARARAEAGDLLFGNIDTFVLWNLTGGLHLTDCTNASRTQLMNLETLDWDDQLLEAFRIPRSVLPRIVSSSQVYGEASLDCVKGVPVAGILGDQQAALVGQTCFHPGEAKNTYGTGCFLLMNTGTSPVPSQSSHRPCAVLKENHRGSSSGTAVPQRGQVRSEESSRSRPERRTFTASCPHRSACRKASWGSSAAGPDQTRRSMVCSRLLASLGGASVETRAPSQMASFTPARAAAVKTSRYVPFRARTTGASSSMGPRPDLASASSCSVERGAMAVSSFGQCGVPSFANRSRR